jgi:hypothetical protein
MDKLDALIPFLVDLGMRHTKYVCALSHLRCLLKHGLKYSKSRNLLHDCPGGKSSFGLQQTGVLHKMSNILCVALQDHFPMIRTAILHTVKETLEGMWSQDIAGSWANAFNQMSEVRSTSKGLC